MRPSAQPARAILAVPLLLALVTLAGLVIGLTGDGWRNLAAWLLAGIPLFVLARARARAVRNSPFQPPSGNPKP
jgi:hypothetical protein